MVLQNVGEPVKHVVDGAALGAAVMGLLSLIPEATVVLAFVWLLMRMYEGYLAIVERRLSIAEKRKRDDPA